MHGGQGVAQSRGHRLPQIQPSSPTCSVLNPSMSGPVQYSRVAVGRVLGDVVLTERPSVPSQLLLVSGRLETSPSLHGSMRNMRISAICTSCMLYAVALAELGDDSRLTASLRVRVDVRYVGRTRKTAYVPEIAIARHFFSFVRELVQSYGSWTYELCLSSRLVQHPKSSYSLQ